MKKYVLLILITIITIAANAQKDSAPDIKEIYYTNKAGEKITGIVLGKEKVVYMVIESANIIGKEVVIKMDEGEEYFYKKRFLKGGSSFRLIIKKDTQKVKLVVYNSRIKKHVKRRLRKESFPK